MIHIDNDVIKFEGLGVRLMAELAFICKTLYENGFEARMLRDAVEYGIEHSDKKEDDIQDRIERMERLLKELKASENEDMEMKMPDDDKPDTFNSVFGDLL